MNSKYPGLFTFARFVKRERATRDNIASQSTTVYTTSCAAGSLWVAVEV